MYIHIIMIRVTRNEICTCVVKIKVDKDYPEEILIDVYGCMLI